jgi:hypothetical protein
VLSLRQLMEPGITGLWYLILSYFRNKNDCKNSKRTQNGER